MKDKSELLVSRGVGLAVATWAALVEAGRLLGRSKNGIIVDAVAEWFTNHAAEIAAARGVVDGEQ